MQGFRSHLDTKGRVGGGVTNIAGGDDIDAQSNYSTMHCSNHRKMTSLWGSDGVLKVLEKFLRL